MRNNIPGIHHVTAIAGDPQTNIDFYAGILGLRLVFGVAASTYLVGYEGFGRAGHRALNGRS